MRIPIWRAGHSKYTLLGLTLLFVSQQGLLAQLQPTALEVVDSNNIVVGTVLDFRAPNAVTVPLLIDGHLTILLFGPAGVSSLEGSGGGTGGVFFASADCTGQGFAWSGGPQEFFEPQSVAGPNRTFYAGPRSTTIPPAFSFNSHLGTNCTVISGTLQNALPVFPVRNLTPPWQPPFRLQAAPEASPVPAVSSAGLLVLLAALAGGGVLVLRSRTGA